MIPLVMVTLPIPVALEEPGALPGLIAGPAIIVVTRPALKVASKLESLIPITATTLAALAVPTTPATLRPFPHQPWSIHQIILLCLTEI